ncbi:hypothetical protein ACLBPW_29960, partial [Klebsiella pneumoniae]|uniref:hypothetical protein n=1 Tax=Klebsiella pneumoniae TaxID=573 RepID=UPI003968201A
QRHSSAPDEYNNLSLELILNTHHTTLWECDNILVKDVTIKQALKEGVDKQLINTDSSFDELVTHLRLTAKAIMDPLDEMDNGVKSSDQAVVDQLLNHDRKPGKFSIRLLYPGWTLF